VFIDPPYNTGSAFTHYDDGLEHSIWLSLIRDRLEIIHSLLSDDGSLWITIDDNEAHYLKVLCDELFGRSNFVANVVWRAADSSNNDSKQFSIDHNHILVYSKEQGWLSNYLERTEDDNAHYKNPDSDPRGPWFSGNVSSPKPRPNLTYDVNSPSGTIIHPPKNGWRWNKERMAEMISTGEISFNQDRTKLFKKTYLADQKGLAPSTVWDDIDDTGHNRQAKYELIKLFPEKATADLFATPKPERLIKKILLIATKSGDIVLDSFAGSGTTGAVAHKLGRKWIMIELGLLQSEEVIFPRLKKVIDGEDQGGISKAVNWQGGGGFRYYSLAPSLLEQDRWGNWVVNKNYNPAMLAEALCKLEGFTYAPVRINSHLRENSHLQDDLKTPINSPLPENSVGANLFAQPTEHWWQHGYSSEQDFIYVTTQNLSHQQLEELSDEVGGDRSLLVCCTAFRGKSDQFPNLTLKKIPKMVLSRCEWAHDDYSLNVANLPMAQPEPEIIKPKSVSLKQTNTDQSDLFDEKA
jgi:adenine-specific DNA-methyltransferase